MTMEEMLAIGLRKPPEGQFYRVAYEGMGLFTLQLREKTRWFSRLIASVHVWEEVRVWDDETETTWHYKKFTGEESLRAAGQKLWQEIATRKEYRTWHEQMQSYVGDHEHHEF